MKNESTSRDSLHPLSRVLPRTPQGPMRSPARVIGWVGIGLGLVGLMMPRRSARALGAPDLPLLTRVQSLRDIGVGVALLRSTDPQPWLWGRVAGDVFDIAVTSVGLVTTGRPMRTLRGLTALAGVLYVDLKTAQGAAPAAPPTPSAFDYSQRSGFPRPAAAMRGAARQSPTPAAELPTGTDDVAGV